MLVTTSSSTPTPGSSSSTSNTLEPPNNSSSANNSRPPSRAPSILDSPTLARVERARLRLEASSQQNQHQQNYGGSSSGSNVTTMNREDSLERTLLDPKREVPWHQVWTHMKRLSHASKVNSTSTLTVQKTDTGSGKCILFPDKTASLRDSLYSQQVYLRPDMQSLLAGRIPVGSMTGPIKRGLLWQQRDRLFSRWKERYFVLTRDYLHCFKRASGSANERASDMGQFIFKVKLVDVEKVEWLNRRNYSAIGLLLGREGRVLLRCDDGLEDWFELLEECTLTSKERRRALKIAQGPRSRASLAAPVSHASLQTNHFGLGGTYSSALEDWLITNGSGIGGRQKIGTGCLNNYNGANPFLFSDSVPDLSALNNENHNHISGISTNHSTPQKIPYSSVNNGNNSRYSNGYASQNSSFSNSTGLYGSPRRIFINSFGSNNVVDEETEDGEVQLRRPRFFGGRNNNSENGNELDREWLYRKPRAPTDLRHSVQPMLPTSNTNSNSNTNANVTANANHKTEIDYSAHDSGLDTPPSTHRPSSYREVIHQSPRDSTETTVSSSRGTLLNSPVGSMRAKHLNQVSNLNQVNALHGSRYSIQQERVLKIRNEEAGNRYIQNDSSYDPNQNRYYKNDRSYSDCQQFPTRRMNNNNPSPMTPRRNNGAIFGTPTRV